jgi:hypothetical protein
MTSASWSTGKGAAKRVYDELQKQTPFRKILRERVPFKGDMKRLGESFQVPSLLAQPNGATYVGANPADTSLLAGRPMKVAQAIAYSYEFDLHEYTPWAVFERQSASGEAAVDSYLGLMQMAMERSAAIRAEISYLRGQHTSGWGIVSSVTDHTTYATIVFTDATWSEALWWSVGPGCTLDSFSTTTKNNATGPLIVVGISPSAKSIDVTYSGTIGSECAAADVIVPEGSWDGTTYYDMPGLLVQAANVSGTSLGLATSDYPNWAGNTFSVGGVMTTDSVEFYIGRLRNRMVDETLTAYMPEPTWRDFSSQLSALRFLDDSYTSGTQQTGQSEMAYNTKRMKRVEFELHPFLFDSEMLIQSDKACKVVGSRDAKYGLPSRVTGGNSDGMGDLLQVTGKNSAETFASWDLGIVNRRPATAVYLSGITH